MKIRLLIVIGLALFYSGAQAQTKSSQQGKPQSRRGVAVYSPGTSSCGIWLDAREAAKNKEDDMREIQFEAFYLGFASAYNWYAGDTSKNILEGADMYAHKYYLDKYCRDNPMNSFAEAVVSLLSHLKSLQK